MRAPRVGRIAALLLVALVPGGVACVGKADRTEGPRQVPSAAPPAAPAPPVPDGPPAVRPGAVAVVAPADEPLPLALIAIDGDDAVLAVSQAADESVAYVQRVGRAGVWEPAAALPGHHVASSFLAADGATTLVTTRGRSICLVPLRGGVLESPRCKADVRADAVVRVGDRVLALAADLPLPEDDEDHPAGESASTRRKEAEREKKKKEEKERKKKEREREREKNGGRRKEQERDVLARRQLAVQGRWLEPISADPESDAPFDVGVPIDEPMAGLGLVGAGARRARDGSSRVDLVFHEWVGPLRDTRDTKAIGRARFGVAVLDGEGALLEGSRGHLGESDLFFGFLGGQVDPRLWTGAGGSVLLTLGGTRGACTATVVTPSRAPMGSSRAACALDPGRFLEAAERLRRPSKDPEVRADAAARDAAFDALATTLLGAGARRAEGQAAWDPGVATLGPTRGFTLLGSGALRSFDRTTAEARDEPRPLVARRARAFAAAAAPDGEVLVRTHDGLRAIAADGTLRSAPDPLPPGGPRPDELAAASSPFAKIGASWWLRRGGAVRVVPPAPSPRPLLGDRAPETAVLVGGEARGLYLELDGAILHVSSIDAELRVRALARSAAPIAGVIEAAARDGGGAILVGPSRERPGRLASFAVDSEGAAGAVRGDLDATIYGLAPRLVATPGHGAIVVGAGGRRVAWLGADGAVLAEQDLGPPTTPGCVDGVAAPPRVPAPRPGATIYVPTLGDEGACAVGLFGWSADGVLRVVVSRRAGAHASVELLRVDTAGRDDLLAPAAAGPLPAPAAREIPTSPRCPPEMVLVDGRFCVDRFEGAIVESAGGRLASPDYPITPNLFAGVLADWATRRERAGDLFARAMPLPRPRAFQASGVTSPRATSRVALLPSGYLTGLVAKEVCAAAGKRLCTRDEWRTACRGEKKTRFPYGDAYREGLCNVMRSGHPAALLHGHASIGHLDPRLGRVVLDGAPGLRPTGSHIACASRWRGDAIYDMVGNLDEWLDEEGGAFAGGFYARRTSSGCDAIVQDHPPSYLDYSTGVRCCRSSS